MPDLFNLEKLGKNPSSIYFEANLGSIPSNPTTMTLLALLFFLELLRDITNKKARNGQLATEKIIRTTAANKKKKDETSAKPAPGPT